jgi:hypothetical protein
MLNTPLIYSEKVCSIYVYTQIYIHTYTYIHTHRHAENSLNILREGDNILYVNMYMCVCMYMCEHVCICMFIYAYICIYIQDGRGVWTC